MIARITRIAESELGTFQGPALFPRWLAAFAYALSFLFIASPAAADPNQPKRVLLLMQEGFSWPIFRTIDENVRSTLRDSSSDGIIVFTEHLDRIHLPDPVFQSQQQAWIQQKYANSGIDLIIAVGDVPTDLFPNVPLLYLSVRPQQARPAQLALSNKNAGISIGIDARKTIDAARRFQPNSRKVVIIAGNSPTDLNVLEQVRQQLAGYSDQLQFTYLTNHTFQEISKEVAALGPESIVLFVTLSRDAASRPFISAEAASKIAAVSGAPVYVLLDTHVGSGVVGGYVTRFAEMGRQAGEMGLRMLAGEHPGDAIARRDYLFDARQLRHWKIPDSALPPDSIVLYRQPSLWETYRYYYLGAMFLALVETLLIFALLWHRAKRKRFQQSLLDRIAFQKIVSDLSNTFISLPHEQVTPAIEQSLSRIGDYLRMDRITLHEISPDKTEFTPTISWQRGNTQSPLTVLKANECSWWANLLLAGEIVLVSDPQTLPAEAFAERAYLQKVEALSLASVPLRGGDEFFGGISFISTQRNVLWIAPLVEQLKLLAEILSSALMRRRAQVALSRHAAIVKSSEDAIISKNLDAVILTWNKGAQRIFGYSEVEAVGQPITLLIPPDLQKEEHDLLRRLKSGEHFEHHETVRLTKSGKRINVSLTISPLKDSTGRIFGFSKIARDITERVRSLQTVRESEERFRLVANSAPSLIWMAGTDKHCVFFNQGWLDFTGRTVEQELGDGWVAGVHPDDVRRCLEIYSNAFDARAKFEMEYRLCRFDGVYRWIVDHGVPRFESDGTFCGYIGSCIDITDRKLYEESLHSLSGRLINAQEEERARIARELHDDFSQRLALLGIGLGQLWKRLPQTDSQDRAKVLEMLNDTKEISSDLHSLSHQLHSSKLEHVGLVAALNGLCGEISEKYKISIRFAQVGYPFNLAKDVELCLFRIAQESLANVAKHSGTKSAQVELSGRDDGVTLRISDQGYGFDPTLRNPAAGIGLIGMSERLRLIGGRLSVDSQLARGTDIIAEVPLARFVEETQLKVQSAGE